MMQATHINFICPMRFDTFPLDTQVGKLCKTNLKPITFLELDEIKWLKELTANAIMQQSLIQSLNLTTRGRGEGRLQIYKSTVRRQDSHQNWP
jgi:hypothetical protein